ncbi:Prenylcysteine oxidase 1 [Wickerhamomyces ciferrii]|uniref:Prenylcysteine oxidase 1 n=1 Tax=Wickerhamomyces ciferrii (strain ATCC 14091 / BCRC 22168 / CBS 111 / JCM 3599 / NBRC 0793 / NRRL Y-1031 F-60-10) TaxID=1206466 RepID=K0KUT7_WICCF|nr:Prenylcysteine oxidase 1 [Wickerhamomyces ciferrii]CCH45687.1 Prenylcysteine oxidase 1 [Wickerhamomyces ciferrii]
MITFSLYISLLVIGLLAEVQQPLVPQHKERIAIIGAGAGGSSAAYHLQNFTSHYFNITIFEKNNYIGGRSTTIENYDNSTDLPIELGASVFVNANKILFNAVEQFGLETQSFSIHEQYPDIFKGSIGIWNGTDFVYKTKGEEGVLFGTIKFLWKYGLSPIRSYLLVRDIVKKFINDYYRDGFPFTLNEIVQKSGFDEFTNTDGESFLISKSISEIFTKNIIEAATRVNYASNVDEIHGLEAVVSLAAEDTVQVVGGNYKIFEKFIDKSEAKLSLNTGVHNITKLNGKWTIHSDLGIDDFDQVIIAAPLRQTGITINGEISELQDVEYRKLHVTYVTTSKSNPVNHKYFGIEEEAPELILTSSGIDHIPFFSVNVVHYDNITERITYKIFSPDKIDSNFLSSYLFNDITDVDIVFEKLWNPYPVLKPTDKFDDFKIGDGIWYLNSIERFISTMETSALAGASVAGLISEGKNTSEIRLSYV